jgi:NAD(P)H-hydrate repair Nnr-like enzyme with NAD(P)H-hydrate dehydratase domain
MTPEYWLKQLPGSPLYEDILWSRPEHRANAGKLLVIGGNLHGFAAVAEAYAEADRAGAGAVHVVLPDALSKTVGSVFAGTEFAPSTSSGSFGRTALSELLHHAQRADAVLLAGDFGRNSETSAMLESFAQKYPGLLTVTKDGVDYLYLLAELVAKREHTVLVLSIAQLQKLGLALKFTTPFLLSMGMVLLVQALHDFTQRYPVTIVTKELDNIVVAHKGKVSSTKLVPDKEIWRVSTAASATTFWMQNPSRPFEAITSSLL